MPLEAHKAIKFVGHQVSSEGKKQFGTYTIRCQDRDGHEWTCEKRYSEFAALDEELREWMDAEHAGSSTGLWAPSLPPKRLWPGRDSVIAERKKGLQRYIDWIITLEATVPRQVLLQFLLPESCAPRMESPRSQ